MDRGGCHHAFCFARKRTSLDSLAVSCSKSGLCVHKCILTCAYVHISLRWTKRGEVMSIFVTIFSSMLPRDEGRGSDVYIKSYLGHPRILTASSGTQSTLLLGLPSQAMDPCLPMLPGSLPNSLCGQLPELTGQVPGKDREVGTSLPELGCSGRYGGCRVR